MASQFVEFGVRLRLSDDSDGARVAFQRIVELTRESVANLKVMSGVVAFAGGEGATTLPLGDIAEAYIVLFEATVDGWLVAMTDANFAGGAGFTLKKRLAGNALALLMTSATAITVDPNEDAGDLYYCIAGV